MFLFVERMVNGSKSHGVRTPIILPSFHQLFFSPFTVCTHVHGKCDPPLILYYNLISPTFNNNVIKLGESIHSYA
jgi:hypothetical protein